MSSNTMIAIKDGVQPNKVVANLLPCRIQHNGPVDPIDPFWKATEADDKSKVAYFRGRKLLGKAVPLPSSCRGVILERKADELHSEMQRGRGDEDEDDDMVPLESVGTLQTTAEFDEVVVWGHEETATAGGDPYVRGMEEWIAVADKIHAYEESESK